MAVMRDWAMVAKRALVRGLRRVGVTTSAPIMRGSKAAGAPSTFIDEPNEYSSRSAIPLYTFAKTNQRGMRGRCTFPLPDARTASEGRLASKPPARECLPRSELDDSIGRGGVARDNDGLIVGIKAERKRARWYPRFGDWHAQFWRVDETYLRIGGR